MAVEPVLYSTRLFSMGVGYRYVSFAESMLLLKMAGVSHDLVAEFAAGFHQ